MNDRQWVGRYIKSAGSYGASKDINDRMPRSESISSGVGLRDVKDTIFKWIDKFDLITNPPFQRPLVWTEKQQAAFIEHWINGGNVHPIIINWPAYQGDWESLDKFDPEDVYHSNVVVDGQQRINALVRFFNGELLVFDGMSYEDVLAYARKEGWNESIGLNIKVTKITDYAELLRLYLRVNDTGVPHTREELDRVQKMREDWLARGGR